IKGRLTVRNTGDHSTLIVRDPNDDQSRDVVLGVQNGFGFITGLAPAAIRYKTNDITTLTVTAGDQGNPFTLTDTFQNKADTAQTEPNTGSGDDTVNVEHTSGRLQINGVGGQDTVRLGRDHSVRGLKADVDVANDDGATKLIVDDQADTGPRTVLMTTFFAVG